MHTNMTQTNIVESYSAAGDPSTPIEMLQVRFSNTTPTVSAQVCTVVYPPMSGDSQTIASLPQVLPLSVEKTALTLVRSVALWLPAWTSIFLAGLYFPRPPERKHRRVPTSQDT